MKYIDRAIDEDIENEWTYQIGKKVGGYKADDMFKRKKKEYSALKNASPVTRDTFKDFLGNL